MKALYLAWQDPISRRWLPVGKLTHEQRKFRFVYTKGARASSNFIPFGRMTDLYAVYESDELFPLFQNRLLDKNRPEYKEFLQWLNVKEDQPNPLDLLATTEGIRGTDSLRVFPCPKRQVDGTYRVHFFSHGLRYLHPDTLKTVINELKAGTQLHLMLDAQNKEDCFAVALRTEDPPVLVGYAPRYFASDFRKILLGPNSKSVHVFVERINLNAPTQLRLLCSINAIWPKGFAPCSSDLYETLAGSKRKRSKTKGKRVKIRR